VCGDHQREGGIATAAESALMPSTTNPHSRQPRTMEAAMTGECFCKTKALSSTLADRHGHQSVRL
jgi:hypothetical protein